MQTPRSWLLLFALSACDGETFSVDVPIDETVPLAGIATVVFDTDVGLDVRGLRRVDELTATATITLTTTSTETLEQARQVFALDVAQEGSTLTLRLKAPGGIGFDFEQARLSGVLTVGLPDDVDLEAAAIGGGIRARDMTGDLILRAAGPVNADPAEGDVVINAGSGGVFVRAELPSGAQARIQANAGNLEFVFPPRFSARVRAESRAGSIILDHPDLPLRPSGRPYDATVGSGLADVQVLTLSGDILLRD